MSKFFETKEYTVFKFLIKILGFTEDLEYSEEPTYRWFSKDKFQCTVDKDSTFRLYKDGRNILSGAVAAEENQAQLIELSRDRMYKTLEDWLASRVTAAATYRRLADERMEAARHELTQFAGLEASLTRSLHDLRKTAKIVEEGHQ